MHGLIFFSGVTGTSAKIRVSVDKLYFHDISSKTSLYVVKQYRSYMFTFMNRNKDTQNVDVHVDKDEQYMVIMFLTMNCRLEFFSGFDELSHRLV